MPKDSMFYATLEEAIDAAREEFLANNPDSDEESANVEQLNIQKYVLQDGDIAWQAEFFADEEEQGECLPMLSGCGSIISRTVPGQGHGNQYYPGVQWDVRDSAWRYLTILDLPFSLVFDTLLLPLDASHGPYN